MQGKGLDEPYLALWLAASSCMTLYSGSMYPMHTVSAIVMETYAVSTGRLVAH